MTTAIRFDDGAAYERFMGAWSRTAGAKFLDWLSAPSGARWLDVGCGNGAFTQLLVDRCAPAEVQGIDPSEEQIAYARGRIAPHLARFRVGDAMALPFPDATFDVAVMPLVIFFVPVPATGVAEMVRVVRKGGIVAAYAWDMPGGGFPYAVLHDEMRAMGIDVPFPPSPDASRAEALRELWSAAGLEHVEVREIEVERTFEDFDDYWATIRGGPSVGSRLGAMTPEDLARLAVRLKERTPAGPAGRITCRARANAVKGRVAGVVADDPGSSRRAQSESR